ncbi:MAG: ATP-binding cassette domain-containing protein [Desulfobacteraceae bacterium]|nr:ATP-binding cassette domain-containing protein [Desulfobacteraceae bacterium]
MTLELNQLKISHNNTDLFNPISILIKKGEIATVMGPSGCGKSTLLSAICGNLSPDFYLHGDILLDGRSIIEVPMELRRIGVLFQDDLLFPHMDIGNNLAFAIPRDVPKKEKKQRINKVLETARLKGFFKRDPATLSGGQRARVSLLRSLLAEPKALLLDEPFSKLDKELKDQMRSFVFSQIRKMNIPALLVTHDPDDSACEQVISL